MKLHLDIHAAQAEILRTLLFKPAARFSELNSTELSNDHFTFHLKQLLQFGLIEKDGSNYRLSVLGKEFANRMDTDDRTIERQGKIGALLVPIREQKGRREYLLQQRLKQPFYDFVGFMTGKIRWGETILEGAARELEEETGLKADLEFKGINHKIDYGQDGALLEDKYFYIVKATDCRGSFIEEFEGGKNFWCTAAEAENQPKVFGGIAESIAIAEASGYGFTEDKYTYTAEEY